MENSVNELKGLIKEIMDESSLKEAQAKQDEAYAKLLEENKALKEAEEARKKAPGKDINIQAPTGESVKFVYKGYDLRRQAIDLEIPEERKESHAKFVIDMINKAALTEANTGAYLVPDDYELSVMALARLESVALRDCRIFNIGKDVLKIPVELTGTSVDVQTFGTTNTESEPTLAEITLDMKRIGNYSIVYNDLLEDSFFDITSWITGLTGEAVGQSVDEYVFTGSSFTGDLYDLTTNVVTVSGSNGSIADISYSHFSEAIADLTDNKLGGAKFYFNKSVTHYVRTEEDSNGRPIWVSPAAGSPGSVYGYPYVQVEKLTAAPSSGGAFGIFADLKKVYALGVRKGMTMQINPYILMKEGKTQIICHARMDGDVMIESAGCIFKLV